MNIKSAWGLLLLSSVFSKTPVSAQAGALDTQFGTAGIAQTAFGTFSATCNAMTLQPDGKIVLGGVYSSGGMGNMAFARLNPNGVLDNTFGAGGKFNLAFSAGVKMAAVQMATGGKIIAAGSSNNKPVIARLTANGAADAFGTGGVVEFDGGLNGIADLVVLSNGKMVGCGIADLGNGKRFAAFRRNADGTPDNSFGTNGFAYFDVGQQPTVTRMAIQPDGKILLSFTFYFDATKYDLILVRLTANGAIDNTFDTDGIVTTTLSGSSAYEQGFAIDVQQDNKIVVAARIANVTPTVFAVVRYNSNGALDNTFGTSGRVTVNFNNNIDEPKAIALQPDGKILVAGTSVVGSNRELALARVTQTGVLDNTFSGDGKVTAVIGTRAYGEALAIQTDGKILVGGYALVNNQNQFVALRYLSGIVVGAPERESGVEGLRLFPNPAVAGAGLSLQFHLNRAQSCRFQLLGADGRLLESYPARDLPAGPQTLSLPLPADLPAGRAVLQITTESGTVAVAVLVAG